MELYTIRHGETDFNKTMRIQGWIDVPLNERGLAQAECAAKFLSEMKFDMIISSTLSRAYRTAEIILAANKYKDTTELVGEDRLKEIRLGVLEGGFEESERMQVYLTDPFNYIPPEGGESFHRFCARFDDYVDELIRRPELQDKTILLSTHACASRAILRYFHEDKNGFWRERIPPNCSLNHFSNKDGTWKIVAQDIVPTGMELL